MAKDTEKLEEDDTPIEQIYKPIIPEDPLMEPISEADEIQHGAFDAWSFRQVHFGKSMYSARGQSHVCHCQATQEAQGQRVNWEAKQESTPGYSSLRGII